MIGVGGILDQVEWEFLIVGNGAVAGKNVEFVVTQEQHAGAIEENDGFQLHQGVGQQRIQVLCGSDGAADRQQLSMLDESLLELMLRDDEFFVAVAQSIDGGAQGVEKMLDVPADGHAVADGVNRQAGSDRW